MTARAEGAATIQLTRPACEQSAPTSRLPPSERGPPIFSDQGAEQLLSTIAIRWDVCTHLAEQNLLRCLRARDWQQSSSPCIISTVKIELWKRSIDSCERGLSAKTGTRFDFLQSSRCLVSN
jgi:hypothetical protein